MAFATYRALSAAAHQQTRMRVSCCWALEKQRVDICELVHEVLDELRASESGRELDIRVGELPPGLADRAFLRRATFTFTLPG